MRNIFSKRIAVIMTAILMAALLFAGCGQLSDPAAGLPEAAPRSVILNKDARPKEGVKATTFYISSIIDLIGFAQTVQSNPEVWGVLTADITLPDPTPWTPIGEISSSDLVKYIGTFDGQGHTISGLEIRSSTSYAGFFAINDGTIKDLTLQGTINVTPSADVDYIGGVVGYNDINGNINRVISKMTINADGDYTHNIGGIAGFNGWDAYNSDSPHSGESYQPGGYINQCRNEGIVTGGFNKIGGIVGENAGTVVECVNTAEIICTKDRSGWPGVGGIVGRNGNNNDPTEKGVIRNSYNRGQVTDKSGSSSGHNAYGGITGWCNQLSIVQNCYTSGLFVPESGAKNPIIGQADNPTTGLGINNYSWDGISTAGSDPVLIGIRVTDAYMRSQDFVDHLNVAGTAPYVMKSNDYPILQWEN
jgi:hypothetical protein